MNRQERYINMKDTKSLIKDDDAIATAALFGCLGLAGTVGGLFNMTMLCIGSFVPAISSLIGGSIGVMWGNAHTWIANILTA